MPLLVNNIKFSFILFGHKHSFYGWIILVNRGKHPKYLGHLRFTPKGENNRGLVCEN